GNREKRKRVALGLLALGSSLLAFPQCTLHRENLKAATAHLPTPLQNRGERDPALIYNQLFGLLTIFTSGGALLCQKPFMTLPLSARAQAATLLLSALDSLA